MGKILKETWPLIAVSVLLLLVLSTIDELGGLGRYGFAAIFPWSTLCGNYGVPDAIAFIGLFELPSLLLQFPIYIVYLYKAHVAHRTYSALAIIILLHISVFATTLVVTHWDEEYCRNAGIIRVIFR